MPNPVQSEIEPLLNTAESADLGPGPRIGRTAVSHLRTAMGAWSLGESAGRQRDLLGALVLLWHDHLAAAHEIVQRFEDPDGSLLHAMQHRREPDYGNAKYWFRRAGRHASGRLIADRLDGIVPEAWPAGLNDRLLPGGAWDPLAFVDLCQKLALAPANDETRVFAIRIQRVEFLAVLDHLCAG